VSSTYIHGTAPDEQRRLSLMNDVLLNPAFLRAIALRGDEKVLDLGSGLGQFSRAMARALPNGRVVGIERDETQRAAAMQLAEEAGERDLVDFRAGDALALDLGDAWGTFDVAHTRFLLEHLPNPQTAVNAMVRAVRPGGRIVLADDDHDVLRLWPEPPGMTELWRAYMRTYDRIGNDPFIGRRLVALLHDAGAKPVRNDWIFFGACAGMEIFEILSDNMAGVVRTARETIVGMSLFGEREFDAVMLQYEQWRRRADAALWFSVCYAEGVRP
jgi:SAM-dependent methyltransferase